MTPISSVGRFAGIEKKTIRFVFGSGVALLLLVAAVAIKQDYFSQTTSLYFFAPNAQGLNKGMAVKFIGFKVGSVEEISMEPNATVKVRLSLNNNYIHHIGQDAKARLMKEALVGESVVEIVPGAPQARQVAQNGVLAFERGHEIGEIVESLAGQIQPILADIKKITSAVSGADEDIRQTIRNVNLVSRDMAETSQQLNIMAQNGNQKIDALYGKVDHALDQTNTSLAAASHTLKTLDEALPKLMSGADASMENIQATTAGIKKMTSEAAEQVPQLIRSGNTLMQSSNLLVKDSQEIMTGVKKSWPIRNLLPEAEEHILPLDGYAVSGQQGAKQ